MRAFKATFRAYVVEENQPAALRAFNVVRATCIARGVDPGAVLVQEVTDEELTRIPDLKKLVERKTRPAHGPVATGQEREDALRAVAIANGGDATTADATLGAVEKALGYLPRSVARELVEKHTAPARAVA